MTQNLGPVSRLWQLVRGEKSDITAIYFYAVLSGLIQLSLPVGIQAIIGFVIGGTLSASLILLITVLVLAVVATGIIQLNQMRIIEKIQQRIFVRHAWEFADHIPRLDLKKSDGIYLPELVNRFFDTITLQKGFAKLLLDLPLAVIQILFGLILLSFYHPFFILFGILVIALLWLILRTTGHRGLQSSLAESSYKYAVAGWLEEMARLVKSFKFSGAGLHLKKADEKTGNYLRSRTRHFLVLELQYKVLIVFKVLITTAMLLGGVLLLLEQQINIGQFVAAEIIIITIIAAIEKIITSLGTVYDVLTSVEKIAKLTDRPLENGGNHQLVKDRPISISATDLSFGYNEKMVVSGLSFNIRAGDKVVISGPSGSGKSTLLKLLAGVYNDFRGQLLVNGLAITSYDPESLRERMGILFQHENIFHGTLWENLTMGRADADPGYVHELCLRIGLQSFLASLPDGYQAALDPAGKRLPRSVVQKILLVRALAHRPSLLIMEEPWLGIEDQFRQQVRELVLGRADTTVIVATTDEGFAKYCNSIIQLDDKTQFA